MSSALANDAPAKAVRRKMRHQPAIRLSQAAPAGMKAWWIRGWAANQSRMGPLVWLDRLSAIRYRSAWGEAWSSVCSSAREPAVLRAGAGSLQHLPSAHAQGAVDPGLLASAVVVERHLDAVAIG